MEIQDNPQEILAILIDLQNLEDKASSLHKEINQIPEEISRHETELATYALQLETAEQKAAEAEKERRSLEGEVESLRQKMSNYKNQLMSVKTNVEYQAMLHEISFVEKKIAEKEDAILEHMLDLDCLVEELRNVGKIYGEKKQVFALQKVQLEEQSARNASELAELETRRNELEESLPAEHLSRYRRIASARHGQAVAFLVGQNCSACHVRLRPQLITEVKTGKRIIQCENCSRILISG